MATFVPGSLPHLLDKLFSLNETSYKLRKADAILCDEELKAILIRVFPDHLTTRQLLLPVGTKGRLTIGKLRAKYNAHEKGAPPRCVSFRYDDNGTRVELKWGNRPLTREEQAAHLHRYMKRRRKSYNRYTDMETLTNVEPLGELDLRRVAKVQATLNSLPNT